MGVQVPYLSTYGIFMSSTKQIKVLFPADPNVFPDFLTTIYSIPTQSEGELVKELKEIVFDSIFSDDAVYKYLDKTAVLPVPALPMKQTDQNLST